MGTRYEPQPIIEMKAAINPKKVVDIIRPVAGDKNTRPKRLEGNREQPRRAELKVEKA